MDQQHDWKHIAGQLRCPSGANATETGKRMNEGNERMNHAAIDFLSWHDNDHVLEIGPGNGAFVPLMLSKAADIRYHGVDHSPEMIAEATALNEETVASGTTHFRQGGSDNLPFPDHTFDKIITVNTIYFWENPLSHLAEIKRTLKPGGLLCLALRSKSFMEAIPFTVYGFNMYAAEDIKNLLADAGFHIKKNTYHQEESMSITGESIPKDFLIFVAAV